MCVWDQHILVALTGNQATRVAGLLNLTKWLRWVMMRHRHVAGVQPPAFLPAVAFYAKRKAFIRLKSIALSASRALSLVGISNERKRSFTSVAHCVSRAAPTTKASATGCRFAVRLIPDNHASRCWVQKALVRRRDRPDYFAGTAIVAFASREPPCACGSIPR